MAFDWMEANSRGRTRGPKAQLTEAVLEQAGLLRRLGYDAKACHDTLPGQRRLAV